MSGTIAATVRDLAGRPVAGAVVSAQLLCPPSSMGVITACGSGNWNSSAPWPGGIKPTRTDYVIIPAGLTVTQNDPAAEAKRVVAMGTLLASRSVSSKLTCFGSLIIHGGTLDYGRTTDRIPSNLLAEIVFDYSEAGLGAGPIIGVMPDPMDPTSTLYDTDAGLWAMMNALIYMHGAIKDGWTELTANALSLGSVFSLDGRFTYGWAGDDELAFAPTDMPSGVPNQHEYRTLGQITGAYGDTSRACTLKSPQLFGFDHKQWTKIWTDRHSQSRTELLRGEVANLTRNVIIRSARPTDRAHTMFMNSTRSYIGHVRFKDLSPAVKPNMGDTPMARYADHNHRLLGNAQPNPPATESYRRGCVYDGAPGSARNWAGVIHESDGIEYSECVAIEMGTSIASGSNVQANAMTFEDTTPLNVPGGNGVNGKYESGADCRIFRCLTIKSGNRNSPGLDNGAFWTGRGQKPGSLSVLVDCHGAGHDGSDEAGVFVWPQTNAAESLGGREEDDPSGRMPSYRLRGHSSRTLAWKIRTNKVFRPVIDIGDNLGWRCLSGIEQHGAYASGWAFDNSRGFEWGAGRPALEHSTHSRLVTDGILDGGNLDGGGPAAGVFAFGISNYVASSVLANEDSIYEWMVVRNVDAWAVKFQGPDVNARQPMWVQFSRVDFGGFKILFGMVSFNGGGTGYGNHPQEGFPPFHDRSPSICGVAKGIGYGDFSILRLRNILSLPNTADVSFDLRHKWDTLASGSEPAMPEDYGRSARTSETYPVVGSNAGAKKSNVAGTDLARAIPPRIRLTTPADYSAQTGNVTVTADTNAEERVEFYELLSNWRVDFAEVLKGVPGPGDWAPSAVYNMATHPYRLAYFRAEAHHSREVADAAMTNGSATLTSASGPFRAGDVGKLVCVEGATAGDTRLTAAISAFVSATQVTLASPATRTVSAAEAVINAHPTGGDRRIIHKSLVIGVYKPYP